MTGNEEVVDGLMSEAQKTGLYKHIGVRELHRIEKAEVPKEFRSPVLLLSMDVHDEHSLRIGRHLEGATKVVKGVSHEVRTVPAGVGTLAPDAERPEIQLHLYRPKSDEPLPRAAVYWMHGGGLFMETAASDHKICSEMAAQLGVLVVNVEYRLAPEHPYPAAIDDAYAGLLWVHEHADELGFDRDRLVIGGESGGGGLAACLGQLAHDRNEVEVAAQILLYPMMDDRTELTAFPQGVGEMMVRPVTVLFGWVAYLGYVPSPDIEPPPYASGARREDVSGLPPTWLGDGTLDLLCEETVAYGERLKAAGVETEVVVVPGMWHGMDALKKPASTPIMQHFINSKLNFMRRYLGLPEKAEG